MRHRVTSPPDLPLVWDEPSDAWADLAAIDLAEGIPTLASSSLSDLVELGHVVRDPRADGRYWWRDTGGDVVMLSVRPRCCLFRLWAGLRGRSRDGFAHYGWYVTDRMMFRPPPAPAAQGR